MDPMLDQLIRSRALTVPPEDRAELEDEWLRLRAKRESVDESLLGAADIAVVYAAGGHDNER